jgi:hypothetical protein
MEQTHDDIASDSDPVVEAGLVVGAKRLAGTIKELWRYPVKSMLGGTVSALLVTEQGGLGDRAWALRDQRNGRIQPPSPLALCGSRRLTGTLRMRGRKMLRHASRALSADRWFSITSHTPMRRQASTVTRYSAMSRFRR